jgi:hypothetical protein
LLLILFLAACATVEPRPGEKPLGPGEIASAHAAREFLEPRKTTKADVRQALGEAVVVDFTSGYEVWVYRERPKQLKKEEPPVPGAELVLLFEPSGVLSKTRVRDGRLELR